MKRSENKFGWMWIGRLLRDFRFAGRMLCKKVGFTAVSALTLGLGIGAVSVFFGLFDALVIRPFPYPDADRIVYIWSNYNYGLTQSLSRPDFEDIRDRNRSFSDIGVYYPDRLTLSHESSESVYATHCTSGVLRTFGMKPHLGRLLEAVDEKAGAAPVAVISHSLWQRVFGGDAKAIGRTIRLDGQETTVVGVMPSDFEFQSPWYRGFDVNLWLPLNSDNTIREGIWQARGEAWLLGVGRLKEGVAIAAADAEIKTIGALLASQYPESNLHKPFLLRSLRQQITEKSAYFGMLMLGAVTLLLLVACANVASMLLARGARRQDEFGIRLALGGSRRDIIRLLLCESLLMAVLGCIVGVILAKWGLVLMQHVIPSTLMIAKRREALQLNGLLLAFSVGVSMLTGILSGMAPAVSATRTPVVEVLKSGGRSQTGARIRHRLLQYLVAGQIVVAVTLGNSAILFSSSYLNVLKDNGGLDTDQVVIAEFILRGERYADTDVQETFLSDLFERIHGLSGIEAVAVSSKLPLAGGMSSHFLVDHEPYDPSIQRPLAERSMVSSGYFSAMGISLLRGRFLGPEDVGSDVEGVVVNQTLANTCWPGEDPIGRTLRDNSPDPMFQATVVGVVADVRQYGAETPAVPEIYFHHVFRGAQSPMILVVRTSGDGHALMSSLRRVVAELDPDLSLANVSTIKEVLRWATERWRFIIQLAGLLMVSTLILAMVGVYGTLSYTVSQRRREIGIRMALGAKRSSITKFVFRQAAVWVLAGLAIGLALTVIQSFLLRSVFYGVSPVDPLLLLMGLAAVGIGAGAACFFPTRRASRVEPMEALRCE